MYIGESGDLGFTKGSSKVLVISALIVEDSSVLDRIIKNISRNKFNKELKGTSEIKANKSSPELRKHIINQLNLVHEALVFNITFLKERLTSDYLLRHKDKLYNFIAGKLAVNINLYDCDLEVRVDKSKGKQLLRDDFNQYFERSLRMNSSIGRMDIYHSYSHSFSGLQFADLISWSVFQREERGNPEYVNLFGFQSKFYDFPENYGNLFK